MSLYQAAFQGITLARQAIAQGAVYKEDGSLSYVPAAETWATFYQVMNDFHPFKGTEAVRLNTRSEDAHALACCDAFRNAYRAYVQLHGARTLTDDARGLALRQIFELGANTGLCERFASFTDSELTDLVMWVTTYGMQMAHEARVCTRCKAEDCFVMGCKLEIDYSPEVPQLKTCSKPAPLPFSRPGE